MNLKSRMTDAELRATEHAIRRDGMEARVFHGGGVYRYVWNTSWKCWVNC